MDEGERTIWIGRCELPVPRLDAALYVVATPIGNLGDVTLRGLEVMAGADILACEDTRVTRVLLDRYNIRRRPVAYHDHNAAEAGPRLISALREGRSVALISDAGTPLVSDPGYRLVGEAIAAGIKVVPVPGASAALAALAVSGLPSDTFLFAGFLPPKDGARRTRLDALKGVPATLLFFESPRRLADSLDTMASVLGGMRAGVVARELTKTFEEVRRASLAELSAHYRQADTPKGEIVVAVGPPPVGEAEGEDVDRLLLELAAEMGASKAAAEAARMTGGRKTDLYRRLLDLRGDDG